MSSDRIVAKPVYVGWGFEVVAFEAGGKDWQYVRQKPAAGVAVMAVRDDGRVAMIRIRRKTSLFGELITELPRGGMDAGEDAQAAAVRELEEETGIGPGEIRELIRLGETVPDNGITSTVCHLFLARVDYEPGDADGLSADQREESISGVVWMSRDEIRKAILAGRVRDPFYIAADWLAQALRQSFQKNNGGD